MCRVTSPTSPLIPFTSTWRRRVHYGRRLHSPSTSPTLPDSTHFLIPPAFLSPVNTISMFSSMSLSFKKEGEGHRFLLNGDVGVSVWLGCLLHPPYVIYVGAAYCHQDSPICMLLIHVESGAIMANKQTGLLAPSLRRLMQP